MCLEISHGLKQNKYMHSVCIQYELIDYASIARDRFGFSVYSWITPKLIISIISYHQGNV